MYMANTTISKIDPTVLPPVSRFVEAAKRFESDITIISKNEHINAKSFRGLLASALRLGSEITLKAVGPDEVEAIAALCSLIGP